VCFVTFGHGLSHADNLFTRSEPYVEGSCITDPCWYAVDSATGKEVVILDLYPDTNSGILVEHVAATTQTGSPVRVMCNSSAVSGDVGFECIGGLYKPTAKGLS
jgi:hypothetical protein